MKTHYVLIDFENVRLDSLGRLKEDDHFRVFVFLGPNDQRVATGLAMDVDALNDRAQFVQVRTPGKNALDFHIAYYLGILTVRNPEGFFHVISKDKGFDALIRSLRDRKMAANRSESIEEMPCFRQPEKAQTPPVSVEELLPRVIDDLRRRKTARPRTEKTLINTIHARCGKERPLSQIEFLYRKMKQDGYIRIEGKQVVYNLS